MAEPINYAQYLPQTNPLQGLIGGFQQGQQAQQQEQLRQQQLQEVQQAKDDLNSFLSKPNKTAEDYNAMMIKYPKLKDSLTASYKTVADEKKLNDFNVASQISGALSSGNNDLAKKILLREKEAYTNSGDTRGASSMDNLLLSLESNPQSTLEMSNMFMASMYPDKFKDIYSGRVETGIKQQKAPFEIGKIKSEIDKQYSDIDLNKAQKSKIFVDIQKAYADINKTNADTQSVMQDSALKMAEFKQKVNNGEYDNIKLNTATETLLNKTVVDTTNNFSLAKQYDNLAEKFKVTADQYGKIGQGKEAVKQFVGNQDEITRLKNEYLRIKNSAVLSMLPAGPATDKDVAIFSKPFPDENSSPEYLANFLKSMSNLQKYEGNLNNAKSEWIVKNGNLGNARKDFAIGSGNVTKGITFNDYVSKNILAPNTAEQPKFDTVQEPQIPQLEPNSKLEDALKKYGG